MSWNVTGIGTKDAVKKEIATQFARLLHFTPDGAKREYVGAQMALVALVDSMPDTHLVSIVAWGSANYDASLPSFNTHIDLTLVAPTFRV